MPQLDPTYFGPQLFWLFVSFITLLIGMRFIVLPRLDIIFKKRQKLLDEKLVKIQELEKNAEHMSVEAKSRLKEVQVESKKILHEAKSKISEEVIRIKHQLTEENVKKLYEANAEIKTEIDKLQKELGKEKTALAANVLENILGHKIDNDKISEIIKGDQ